jgi:hypothetical protein
MSKQKNTSDLSISGVLDPDRAAKKIAKKTQIGMKFGSLQYFMKNEGAIENFSSDNFPRDEVHKIAILDLRILNLDRNE